MSVWFSFFCFSCISKFPYPHCINSFVMTPNIMSPGHICPDVASEESETSFSRRIPEKSWTENELKKLWRNVAVLLQHKSILVLWDKSIFLSDALILCLYSAYITYCTAKLWKEFVLIYFEFHGKVLLSYLFNLQK